MLYRPPEITNLDTALKILTPTYENVNGVRTKRYPVAPYTDCPVFYASFKTRGGTETQVNDVYGIIDTAEVVTWFNPDIQSDCKVARLPDNAEYRILGEPENIDNRGQFMKFKVERVKGKV